MKLLSHSVMSTVLLVKKNGSSTEASWQNEVFPNILIHRIQIANILESINSDNNQPSNQLNKQTKTFHMEWCLFQLEVFLCIVQKMQHSKTACKVGIIFIIIILFSLKNLYCSGNLCHPYKNWNYVYGIWFLKYIRNLAIPWITSLLNKIQLTAIKLKIPSF